MQTATIDSAGPYAARKMYLEYRQAVRERKKSLTTESERLQFEEDEALRRAYFELSRGHKVLDLVGSMRLAGCFENGMPKLAIARADQTRIICCRRRWDSITHFGPTTPFGRRGKRRRDLYFEFAKGVFPDLNTNIVKDDLVRSAMVPSIPISLRPAHALSNYHILWEAVWQPAPPVDPMLLRRLSKNLFAIVAVWDLTDLERAVMNGRLAI